MNEELIKEWVLKAEEDYGSLVIRVARTFSLFWRIRSWQVRLNHREHRGTQRVVIFIFRPLCALCVLCGFPQPHFENIKKSPGFWSLQREIPKTQDYLTVEELYKISVRRFAAIICFHAQQCAEKYLKAVLTSHNIEPPRTHSLETLLDLIVAEVPKLEQYRDLLTDLCPVQRTISISGRGGNPGRCRILCQDHTRTA